MKNILIGSLLLLSSSCEIFEVTRAPVLAPPLGLEVFATSSGGRNQVAVRFQGNNREVYFSGYRIYISVNRADLELTNAENRLFAEVPPPPALVLPNLKDAGDTEMSVAYNGAMTKADPIAYPYNAIIDAGVLQSSSLIAYNGGTPFTTGTYYVGVYAYSRPENRMSIPSIGTFTFP